MLTSCQRSALSIAAMTAALCLQAPSHAKLDVPYGADGSPPDPQTQAAVDALNDALEGPDEGQSTASWQAEVQAAHDALYGAPSCSTTTTCGGPHPATDMCQSPLDIWIGGDSSEIVADAIGTSSVKPELTSDLEEFIDGMLINELWGGPVTIGVPKITSLTCTQCTLTYIGCLAKGLGVTYCKLHTLNCTHQPYSAISIKIPVTAPNKGTITFEASASYREIDDPQDSFPYEWCLDVRAYDTSGFGVFDPVVRKYIESFLSQGTICRHAWDWDL